MELTKMPALNKRFGEIGGKVIIRISVCPLTGSVSPNCVQLTPQLRQAAGTLCEMRRKCSVITCSLKENCNCDSDFDNENVTALAEKLIF